jgi:hypothetical protein
MVEYTGRRPSVKRESAQILLVALPMKGQKERRAPNLRPDALPGSQVRQGGRPGKKAKGEGGAAAQSGSTGHQGKSSPR